jgi:hypothetical protein
MKTAVSAVATGHVGKLETQANHTTLENCAVGAMALAVIFCAVVWAFFVQPHINIDDIGLFNPIYMYVHYGVLTYPAYGFFHEMIVHPPTHYFILGCLLKFGIPTSYVAAVPPFLLIVLSIWLIFSSRLPPAVKLGLLFGMLEGSLIPSYLFPPKAFSFGFRPDLHMTFAWFAGLIALETGRLDDWNPKRLLLGGLLLTYASTLHYVASFAWTGVLVYMLWVVRVRAWRIATRPLLAMAVGGCLIGIPYLLIFVVPHWHDIIRFIESTDSVGGFGLSLKAHFEIYRVLYYSLAQQTYSRILFSPLHVDLPVVVISTLLLWLVPATRGIALASLPQLATLLLTVHHKWPEYLIPELILYVCGLAVCLLYSLSQLVKHIKLERVFLPASALFAIVTLLLGTHWLNDAELTLRPRVLEMDIARAAGRQILGANALVGARIARSYTNGGDLSYMLEPDLLWRKIGDLNIDDYFKRFDAIAEDSFSSELTSNERRESLASWYVGGALNLRGFYFSSLYEHLSYLLLNVHRPTQFQGYGVLPDHKVAHFQGDSNGAFVFVAATCEVGGLNRFPLNPVLRNAYLLPAPSSTGVSQKQLETFVVPTNEYEQMAPRIASQCSIRDKILISEEDVDAHRFVAPLKDAEPIRFFEHLDDAVKARYDPPVEFTVTTDGWLSGVTFRREQHEGEAYSFPGREIHELFRSDMDSTAGWQINRYGRAGEFKILILPNGLNEADPVVRYSSDDARDHLASTFVELPSTTGLLFFSLWTKPLDKAALPNLILQAADYSPLAHARPIITRPDGWILLAGWAEAPQSPKVRIVVIEKAGDASLLDKALLVQSTNPSPVRPTRRNAP